jgi:hypothetical protein
VHEVTISCALECSVAADTKVLTIDRAKDVRFFLEQGHHEIVVSWSDDRPLKTLPLEARAGASDTIAVETPPLKPIEPPAPVSASASPSITGSSSDAPRATAASSGDARDAARASDRLESARRKPLAPIVFFTAAGLTVVAGAATVLSGLDARSNPGADAVRRNCVGLGDACPDYQRGRDAQLRTNVLLAVTGGLFAASAALGVFFTDWSRSPTKASRAAHVELEPALGLGQIGLRGKF